MEQKIFLSEAVKGKAGHRTSSINNFERGLSSLPNFVLIALCKIPLKTLKHSKYKVSIHTQLVCSLCNEMNMKQITLFKYVYLERTT